MATLSDALSAYRICAQAEGKSPKAIRWIMSSVSYFSEFLGPKQEISSITANDFRRFIIALQRSTKFRNHPFNKPMPEKLSPQTIETYAWAIRAFLTSSKVTFYLNVTKCKLLKGVTEQLLLS